VRNINFQDKRDHLINISNRFDEKVEFRKDVDGGRPIERLGGKNVDERRGTSCGFIPVVDGDRRLSKKTLHFNQERLVESLGKSIGLRAFRRTCFNGDT
jgi:hypothetical protein